MSATTCIQKLTMQMTENPIIAFGVVKERTPHNSLEIKLIAWWVTERLHPPSKVTFTCIM